MRGFAVIAVVLFVSLIFASTAEARHHLRPRQGKSRRSHVQKHEPTQKHKPTQKAGKRSRNRCGIFSRRCG